MYNSFIQDMALTFIEEKLFRKNQKQHSLKKPRSVGWKTESNFRACLREIFKNDDLKISESKINEDLILDASDFLIPGIINDTPSFHTSMRQKWGQCDACFKLNRILKILGEIKTTTSANHNICGLINKNLTAIRFFQVTPLSVILYPGMKADSLRKKHINILNGLFETNKITSGEKDILLECFFVLTNKTDNQINGSIKRLEKIKLIEIPALREKLFQNNDIEYSEWERLIAFIKKSVTINA